MNTPAHLIFAAAAFAKPDVPSRSWAALLGALAPDLSLYVMSIWSLYVMGFEQFSSACCFCGSKPCKRAL